MNRSETLTALKSIKDNNQPLFFMLGPCAIESEKHALMIGRFLKDLSEKLSFHLIYKSSFDKANRTSLESYRSVGVDEGLRILQKVREELDVPIVTDIHDAHQADRVAEVADIIQIPAFLCRQTDLLIAAGKTGAIVNIKKGQFASPHVMEKSAKKVACGGTDSIWLCERGYSFGYGDLIVDFRNFPIMKEMGYPVIFDATHSVQKPSALGGSSGGERSCVGNLAISAVAQGIAGLFMEVHEKPENAPCDGPNSMRLSQLEELISYLIELDTWIKSKPRPTIF